MQSLLHFIPIRIDSNYYHCLKLVMSKKICLKEIDLFRANEGALVNHYVCVLFLDVSNLLTRGRQIPALVRKDSVRSDGSLESNSSAGSDRVGRFVSLDNTQKQLRWYWTLPCCDIFPIEINNKSIKIL